MKPGHSILGRGTAAVIATLVVALSVSVPVLEVADLGHGPVMESQHDPGECPRGHDHTICTQVGSNHAVPLQAAPRQQAQQIFQVARSEAVTVSTPSALAQGYASRAPPKV